MTFTWIWICIDYEFFSIFFAELNWDHVSLYELWGLLRKTKKYFDVNAFYVAIKIFALLKFLSTESLNLP